MKRVNMFASGLNYFAAPLTHHAFDIGAQPTKNHFEKKRILLYSAHGKGACSQLENQSGIWNFIVQPYPKERTMKK